MELAGVNRSYSYAVGWQSGGHSNGYVPVFAIGVGAELFSGRIDNTDIPRKIASIAGYNGEM